MPLGWVDIERNALKFSRDWQNATRESADSKSFWDEFFMVFGIRRRVVASFEEPVRTIRDTFGFIDLFWKGMLIAEHKSAGKDLDQAHSQAMQYIQDLKNGGREEEIPRYVCVSDFRRFALHDLEENRTIEFGLAALHQHIHDFAFIPGYRQHAYDEEDPANLKAVGLLGNLHDALEDSGYTGHDLERYLVRILFCLFAEDTGIVEPHSFSLVVEQTRIDGMDTGPRLAQVFDILNTPDDRRQRNLEENLACMRFVDGGLFEERLPIASFDHRMRRALLSCCRFDWSRISPAIFGSLFQAVMEPRERRQIGGHYTSERDILKVIRSLFLDDLWSEYERVKRQSKRLYAFHDKLAGLRLFDPACGCGNFLVVAYRELRLLEMEVLRHLVRTGEQTTGIQELSRIDVDAMFGIEISEFPARIAEVALWLMDHQMNNRLSEMFGQYYVRLPLRKSATIIIGNALRLDWRKILPPKQCGFILGNPPFVGAKYQNDEQRNDMALVMNGLGSGGLLDYVSGWYFKAADYMQQTSIRAGLVSTNSICQGEQVGILWSALFSRGVKIHFAHRTFAWESEARGKAHVHVVIIGFGFGDTDAKTIYDYNGGRETPVAVRVRNISPYLVEGPDIVIANRSKPLCAVPEIGIGNKPIDDGNYLFTPREKEEFLEKEPAAASLFRRWVGSEEFIHNVERWCLWVRDCPPDKLRQMREVTKRVKAVREFRLASKSEPTRKLANYPRCFHVENIPETEYLIIPKVSSEKRMYIPIGFMEPDSLTSDLCFMMPDATLYHFGILSSAMHMAWVRHVCGRLKSDLRYSAKLVYNNFPWPGPVSSKQQSAVERASQAVLDFRAQHPDVSLASLYDPFSMPPKLAHAHAALDRAVDRCYGDKTFRAERERVEFLFDLYEQLASPLIRTARKKPRKR